MTPRRAIFLDRDGVLNEEGGAYVAHPENLQMLPGSAEAVARLTQAGWLVFVFTNQAGVGKGLVTVENLHAVHVRLSAEIESAGGKLTAIYACTHHPDAGCDCRKPKPGMLLQAAHEYGLDLTRCVAVGDTSRDIEAAKTVGCQALLVLSGHTRAYDPAHFPGAQPDHVFPDLAQAVAWLLLTETSSLNPPHTG